MIQSFDTEEMEVLTELVNIGVGRAAASMSDMIEQRIELTVPQIHIGQVNEMFDAMRDEGAHVSAVEQRFSGTFSGMSALMFPTESAATIVCLLLQEEISNANSASLEELEAERESVLTEIGNVLINAIMGSLGNTLSSHLQYTLPVYVESGADDLCLRWGEQTDGAMIVKVKFEVSDAHISGQFLMMFEVGSLKNLHECICNLLS
ncbi:MAG: chemotaxis protein CheC [Planctomycetes bacterium]|nr:chemotaxis protein CheC [Planctomycetota bacterium]